MTIKQKLLNAIDKFAVKIHKKIRGNKEFVTIYFTGGTKAILEEKNLVYHNHELVVEIPEKYVDIKSTEAAYFDIKCKFKIGDGKTPYKELKYKYGTVPAAIEQTLVKDKSIFYK